MTGEFDRKVTEAEKDKYCDGMWMIVMSCGHKTYAKKRIDCMTFPKRHFCGVCYQQRPIKESS